jgi:hypothetical protein
MISVLAITGIEPDVQNLEQLCTLRASPRHTGKHLFSLNLAAG